MSENGSQLSSDSIKSNCCKESDTKSFSSMLSSMRSSCEMTELKTAELQKMNLPAVNCKKTTKCNVCLESHQLYTCDSYLSKTSRGRYAVVIQNIKIAKSKQRSLISVPIEDCKLKNLTTVRILIPDAKRNWQSVEAIIDTASNKNKLKQNREHKVKIDSTERDIANDLTSVHGLRHVKSEKLSKSRQKISSPKNQEYQLTADSSYGTNRIV